MPYGTIKVDTITFTAGGVDTSVSISGLVQNPTFTGNITSTGTISGNIIQGGTTVSGATVTGTAGQFGTLTGNTAGFTTVTGTTITGTTANLVTVSGTTVTGGTARFTTLTGISGVFTTAISGATVTGNTGQFTVVTGGTAGFTTVTGTTVTGTTANFTTLSGTTAIITSGVFASGTAAAPSVSVGTTTNGLFSSGANEVAISTGGSGRLFVEADGDVCIGVNAGNSQLTVKGSTSTRTVSQFIANDTNTTTMSVWERSDGAVSSRLIYDGTGLIKFGTSTAHALTLDTNNQERLRITSTGALNFVGAGTAGSTQAVSFNGSAPVNSLVIDSSGRLGVGTSSPSYPFHLVGTGNYQARIEAATGTSAATLNFGNTSGDYFVGIESSTGNAIGVGTAYARTLWAQGAYPLVFGTNNTRAVTIDLSQRVGIGNSSPVFLLDLAGGSGDGVRYRNTVNSINTILGASTTAGQVGTTSAHPLEFLTGSSVKAILDTSGRLGIGSNATAPDTTLYVRNTTSFDTQIKAVQTDSTGGVCAIRAQSSSAIIDLMAGGSTYATNYMGADEAGLITQATGDSMRFNVGGSYCRWTFGSSEAARLTSSGQLLVGTSSSSASAALVVQGNSAGATEAGQIYFQCDQTNPAVNTDLAYVRFADGNGSVFAHILGQVDGTSGTNDYPGRLVFSTTADGASSPTERMRITQAGHIYFAPSGSLSAGSNGTVHYSTGLKESFRAGTASTTHWGFFNDNGQVGSIVTNASATAFNTSSDYRLKENVTTVVDGINRLQQLKPSRFNFIVDPDKTVDGFLAHEVQAVVPEAITGEKDAVDSDGNPIYQGIDQSKLVPLLTAALQEAIGEIESLKARVAALESA